MQQGINALFLYVGQEVGGLKGEGVGVGVAGGTSY